MLSMLLDSFKEWGLPAYSDHKSLHTGRIDNYRRFKYSDSDLFPVCRSKVSSFISPRWLAAKSSPYVLRNVSMRVLPFFWRISPFRSRQRSSSPVLQVFRAMLLSPLSRSTLTYHHSENKASTDPPRRSIARFSTNTPS